MDIEWPEDLAPFKVAFYLQSHVGGSESPFSRTTKTYGLSAPRWVARYTFRGGDAEPRWGEGGGFARRLDAILALAEGTARFKLWDFRRESPLRPLPVVAPGGLTIPATSKGATTVAVAGFSPYAEAFEFGDYIGGDGRPHLVTASSIADGAGVAQVSFRPPWKADTDANLSVLTSRVPGWFKLARDGADDAGANETELGQPTEYVLTFVEDLVDA